MIERKNRLECNRSGMNRIEAVIDGIRIKSGPEWNQ